MVVCEGASEIGLLRGLDLYRLDQGNASLAALGVALVDCGGGEPDRPYARAAAFQSLGYRVMVLRDDDKKPTLLSSRLLSRTVAPSSPTERAGRWRTSCSAVSRRLPARG